MFHVDAKKDMAMVRFNGETLDYTYLFKVQEEACLESLGIVKLFANDRHREPTIVVFGTKNDGLGKFYLYT